VSQSFNIFRRYDGNFIFFLESGDTSFCFNLCFHKAALILSASYLTTPHYHFDFYISKGLPEFGNFRNHVSRLKTIFFIETHFSKITKAYQEGLQYYNFVKCDLKLNIIYFSIGNENSLTLFTDGQKKPFSYNCLLRQ